MLASLSLTGSDHSNLHTGGPLSLVMCVACQPVVLSKSVEMLPASERG